MPPGPGGKVETLSIHNGNANANVDQRNLPTAHARREIPPTFRFHVTVVERNILIPNVLTKR